MFAFSLIVQVLLFIDFCLTYEIVQYCIGFKILKFSVICFTPNLYFIESSVIASGYNMRLRHYPTISRSTDVTLSCFLLNTRNTQCDWIHCLTNPPDIALQT